MSTHTVYKSSINKACIYFHSIDTYTTPAAISYKEDVINIHVIHVLLSNARLSTYNINNRTVTIYIVIIEVR